MLRNKNKKILINTRDSDNYINPCCIIFVDTADNKYYQ